MAKLISKLSFVRVRAPEAASLALHDTADFILNLIRLYAPVDTGFLRDSYQKESVEQLNIIIGTMVFYAPFQEYGTSRQSGTPHVTPSFVQAESFFKQRFVERMKDLG